MSDLVTLKLSTDEHLALIREDWIENAETDIKLYNGTIAVPQKEVFEAISVASAISDAKIYGIKAWHDDVWLHFRTQDLNQFFFDLLQSKGYVIKCIGVSKNKQTFAVKYLRVPVVGEDFKQLELPKFTLRQMFKIYIRNLFRK